MEFERFANHYVLRLEPGEEVMSTLLDFVDRENIRGGYFLAFGAFSRACLRYFDVNRRQYVDHDVNHQVEVVSLLGNIARMDGQPKIHMHGAVSDEQLRTFSGHIGEATVRPTLEVFLTKFDGEVRRAEDPATGLDLLALRQKRMRVA